MKIKWISSTTKEGNLKSSLECFIRSLGSDSLKVFGGDYEGGIHLQQVPDEISSCVLDLIHIRDKEHFKNYLEIGAASGGSTHLFNYFFNLDNILIIDNNKHKKWHLRKEILKHVRYEEFVGDSHSDKAYEFAKRFMFDLIFIDGDHSYSGVKKDADMYLNLLNLGGLVLFHDTQFCEGVKQVFEEIKLNGDFKLINEYVSETKNKLGIGLLQRIK